MRPIKTIATLLMIALAAPLLGAEAKLPPLKSPAKSVILIFLTGGPSQTDTFDPKPEAGRDYFGMYPKPIQTNNPELQINQFLTKLATIADKYSIIRSMTHNSNAHEIGQYVMLTGDMSKGSVVYPSFGATISYMMRDEYKGELPPFISVPNSSTRFNENGFLGLEYRSFSTGGRPEAAIYEVEGIVSKATTAEKIEAKRGLLEQLNSLSAHTVEPTADVESLKQMQQDNFSLINNSREIFNLKNESKELRTKYGMTLLGQSCLVARRLVEAGTKVVVVNSPAWDTHKEHFKRMPTKLKDLDDALSALINDLDERNMLEQTIVICGGEFGREPLVGWEPPWNGGRGHFGAAFSYLVAGGGFKGGEVLGKSSENGMKVIERPVYPGDFWGTIYYLMGIDPYGTIDHPELGALPIIPPMPDMSSKGLSGSMPSEGIITELIKGEAK